MIKQIGTKIYYCNITGNVIKIIGDMLGYIRETSIEEDFLIYEELKERNRDSVGLIQLEYGKYLLLSKNSTGVIVDLGTKELIFTYKEMSQPPQEPTLEDMVKEQGYKISTLESEFKKVKEQNERILEFARVLSESTNLDLINVLK